MGSMWYLQLRIWTQGFGSTHIAWTGIKGYLVLLGPIQTLETHTEADHSVKENIEGAGQLETEFSSHHVIVTEPSFPIGHAVD